MYHNKSTELGALISQKRYNSDKCLVDMLTGNFLFCKYNFCKWKLLFMSIIMGIILAVLY